MRIGIDASCLSRSIITGVENFLRSVILELSKFDDKNNYYLYTSEDFYNFPELPKNFHIVKSPAKRLWGQKVLPKLVNNDSLDVFYSPGGVLPSSIKVPIVAHVHDLAFKKFPRAYSYKDLIIQNLGLKRLKYARFIIADSESTKTDLIKFTNFDNNKVKVVALGYDEKIKDYIWPQEKRQGITFAGRLEPRKNVINLLLAYEIYAKKTEKPESLTIIGALGWRSAEILTKIKELQDIGLPVKQTNYIAKDEYHQILGSSKIFLYPSLYEGFGLPILESFAAETPIITSNISSMPEVAGNAAVLVDPLNVNEIAKAINKLLTDTDERNEMIKKGKEQLKNYSWNKCAKEILNILVSINEK